MCVCVWSLGRVYSQSFSHSLPATADIRPLSVNRTIDPVPLCRMEGQPGCCVKGSTSGTTSICRITSSASWRRVTGVSICRWPTQSPIWVQELPINRNKYGCLAISQKGSCSEPLSLLVLVLEAVGSARGAVDGFIGQKAKLSPEAGFSRSGSG